MPWGPRWSQSEEGALAHAVGASVIPKRRMAPHPCGGGLGGPKAKEAPLPMPRGSLGDPKVKEAPSPMPWGGPQWSQSEGGTLAHAVAASVIPKRRRPPRPCGGRLGGSQSEGGPLAHAVGASVVPK